MINRIQLPIDLLTLAGIKSILGLDITQDRIRVVELERRISIRGKANYRCRKALTIDLDSTPAKNQAEVIREILDRNTVRSRYAVTTVRNGTKIVQTGVPVSRNEIAEWLSEHADSVLRLPVPISELAVGCEVLQETAEGCKVEIAFVRLTEIDRIREFTRSCGLELLMIRTGLKDLLTEEIAGTDDDLTVVWVESGTMTVLARKGGLRQPIEILPYDPAALATMAERLGSPRLAGELLPDTKREWLFRPFDLEPEYALSGALAVKGFGIDRVYESTVSESLWKKGAQRVTLALSTILLVLLLLPVLLSFGVGLRLEALSDSEAAMLLEEVELLEDQVSRRRAELAEESVMKGRTSLARTFREIATSLPDSLCLTELNLTVNKANDAGLLITGEALERDAVTGFLKTLEKNKTCQRVQLSRLGHDGQRRKGRSQTTGFELQAEFRMSQ